MVSKNTILTLLGDEIDKFSASYEERINDLNNQILQLKKDFNEINSENKVLKAKLIEQNDQGDYKSKYETLLHYIHQLNSGVTYEVIDEWCLSSVVEDSLMLLSSLNHILLDGQDLNKAIYIINLIEHNQRPLEHNDPRIHQLVHEVLTNIYISKHLIDNDNNVDELFISSLNLLCQLSKSSIKDVIKDFITKNYYDVRDTIFYLNVPEIINAYIRVCHYYNLQVDVKDTFNHLFEEEWTFLESSFTSEDFIFLL